MAYNLTDMPRKKPHWDYIEDSVAEAILDITENGMLVCKAGEKWGIPKATLSDRLYG